MPIYIFFLSCINNNGSIMCTQWQTTVPKYVQTSLHNPDDRHKLVQSTSSPSPPPQANRYNSEWQMHCVQWPQRKKEREEKEERNRKMRDMLDYTLCSLKVSYHIVFGISDFFFLWMTLKWYYITHTHDASTKLWITICIVPPQKIINTIPFYSIIFELGKTVTIKKENCLNRNISRS